MKIVHAADIHLGFRAYAKRTDNLNAREADIYESWGRLLIEVIREAPDIFIIAGDLFDMARPSTTAHMMAQGLKGLGCPVLVIAGTHDERRPGDHSPVMLLNALPNVTAVEKTTLHFVNGTSFCLQPWVRDDDITYYDADFFVAHLPICGIPEYAYNKAYSIPNAKYQACFMGDLHRHLIISKNIIYPGPIERFRFNEEGIEVGYVVWDDGNITFKPLKARDLITLTDPVLDDNLLRQCTDKIVRIRLSREIDVSELREQAFHVQLESIRSNVSLPDGSVGTIGKSLRDQWRDFTTSKSKDSFGDEGEAYLRKAMEKQEV